MISLNRRLRAAGMLIGAIVFARAVLAGPPLICHPFTTGADARLLPWAEGTGWHLPHNSYERANLVADTLGLLSADAPILARMENMRRAAIYAARNARIADHLLAAVVARARTGGQGNRIALFDADDVFLEVLAFAGQGLLDDEFQKAAHAPGVREPGAREEAIELAAYVVYRWRHGA